MGETWCPCTRTVSVTSKSWLSLSQDREPRLGPINNLVALQPRFTRSATQGRVMKMQTRRLSEPACAQLTSSGITTSRLPLSLLQNWIQLLISATLAAKSQLQTRLPTSCSVPEQIHSPILFHPINMLASASKIIIRFKSTISLMTIMIVKSTRAAVANWWCTKKCSKARLPTKSTKWSTTSIWDVAILTISLTQMVANLSIKNNRSNTTVIIMSSFAECN